MRGLVLYTILLTILILQLRRTRQQEHIASFRQGQIYTTSKILDPQTNLNYASNKVYILQRLYTTLDTILQDLTSIRKTLTQY